MTTSCKIKNIDEVFFFSNRPRVMASFFRNNPGIEKDVLTATRECKDIIKQIFGSPTVISFELSEIDDHPELPVTAAIRWPYSWKDGMNRYDIFLSWCAENNLHEKASSVLFNIQLTGAEK